MHIPRAVVFKSLQTVISYYVTNNINYTCDTSEHRIELGPRVKLGKCAICPYISYVGIDCVETTQSFLKVVQAVQNPLVAIQYVAEKSHQSFDAVLLSILDQFLVYFNEDEIFNTV